MNVRFSTTTSALLDTIPVTDGQIIALQDIPAYYYDFGDTRYRVSGVTQCTELPDTGVENMLYYMITDGRPTLHVWTDDGAYLPISAGIVNDDVTGLSTTYSSTKIMQLIEAIHQFRVVIVDELPEVGEPLIIYYVKKGTGEEDNYYDEYMWIDDAFEVIGTTQLKYKIATTEIAGIVRPDGTTISVAADGLITAKTATNSALGVVKPDNDTIHVASGTLSVNDVTTSAHGLMTAADKVTLNGLSQDITKIRYVSALPADPDEDTLYLIPKT